MKVILLQDVAKIGRRSDIVEVPSGYAMNQLIPKRMAEPATAANQKRIEKLQADAAASVEADTEKFNSAKTALNEAVVKIVTEANEQGHLFKAVHEKDIAEAAQAAGVSVDASIIAVGAAIKEVGEHTVSLVQGQNKAEFKIEVVKKD